MNALRLSGEADQDLAEIWAYIAGFDAQAADRLLKKLNAQFQRLRAQPSLGQLRPDLKPGLRFLPEGNYLIFYVPFSDGVEIARVIHSARDYQEFFEN